MDLCAAVTADLTIKPGARALVPTGLCIALPEGYEAELLNPFMENMALEISRALQFFFTSTQYNQVDHIVLAGGCAVIPGVDEVVATRTQVNTLIANPFANMTLSDRVKARSLLADASSLMVACGLALRRFDPS